MLKTAIIYAVTVAYFVQAGILWFTNDRAQAVVFLGYAVANLGLIASLQ